jgi:hypothetical protein
MTRSFTASRAMSAATAAYGVYALARPQHLPDALESPAHERSTYLGLARAYGVRDLAVSGFGLLGRGRAVPSAMALRMASDVSDCVLLLRRLDEPRLRTKVAAVTLGWATLNGAALAWDLSRR